MTKIAFFGYKGRVGSVLYEALKNEGYDLIGIDREDRELCRDLEADIGIDFTEASSAIDNLKIALQRSMHFVIGSSGFTNYNSLRSLTVGYNKCVALIPNFSLSLHRLIETGKKLMESCDRAYIIEEHGSHKKDHPSQTSLYTADELGIPRKMILARRSREAIAEQSIVLVSKYEKITLAHTSTDRRLFVAGLLQLLERVLKQPENYGGLKIGLKHFI